MSGSKDERRELGAKEWFSSTLNTILFILLLFSFIFIVFILLLVYKMNPKCRNWIKSWFKKQEVTVDKKTLEHDWNRYVEHKNQQRKIDKKELKKDIHSNSLIYHRVITKELQKTKKKSNLDSHEDEDFAESKKESHRSIMAKYQDDQEIGVEQVKIDNVNHTDEEIQNDEDVDFQGLGLQQYLKNNNVISNNESGRNREIGKKSKEDYVKEAQYYNEQLNTMGEQDLIYKTQVRILKKDIKEKAKQEVRKELDYSSDEDQELFINAPEDEFQRKKNLIRELMALPNQKDNIK